MTLIALGAAAVGVEVVLRLTGAAALTPVRGELARAARPGAFMVLCVGDSHTYGQGARRDESYPAQLAALLTARDPSRAYDVINAGVPGFNSAQTLAQLQRLYADGARPAIVLLCVGKNNAHNFRQARFWQDDALAREPYWRQAAALLERSRAYQLGKIATLNLRAQLSRDAGAVRLADNAFVSKWLAADCREMIELVRNHGGRPALLTYWMSLGAVNDALDAASQTTAAPLIDATLFHQPPWRAARMVAADLHPNALGYAAIARLTLRAIERQGWLPSPAAPTGQPAPNLPASEDLTAPSPPPSWVAIPAGEFTMGCSPGDGDCSSDELPPRRVRIAAFELNATEATQAQFAAVMGRNPSDFPDCAACPVDIVSWEDAAEYCQRTGGRLPSEAEWEYAARAGAATRYPCGDEAACLSAVAWSEANAGWRPHPVARKQHDAFGLYDMLGNVAEWTQDFHHHDYTGGPTDGAAWVSPAGQHRVMRGGAWTDGPRELRASARPWDIPYFGVDFGIGVRCARTPAAAGAVQ